MTYQPYEPQAARGDQPTTSVAPGAAWRVAIEYTNGGQAKPSMIVTVGSTAYVTRERALKAAEAAARSYDPPDPWSPRRRRVFRDGPDGFLVLIEGATMEFPMSVRIVQDIT